MIWLFDDLCDIAPSIEGPYSMSREDAERLFQHMWIYTHGIATMCANGSCIFTDEEISQRLTEVCTALIKEMKG
jgi:hypothetical protein